MTAKKPSHHTVLSLRVKGGFLDGATLDLADGLNCFIGGRGTGKTTALEFLRYSLDLMPDQRAHPTRFRAIDGLVKFNLGDGRLITEVKTRGGLRYSAERSISQDVQVFNEAGVAVPVSLAADLIFGADVFSQNQIEEIASNPAAQLSLLDRFVEAETALIVKEIAGLHQALAQTSKELRALDGEISDLAAAASELAVLQEKLKALAPAAGPDAAGLNAAQSAKAIRARTALLPERLTKATAQADLAVRAAAATLGATVDAQFSEDLRSGEDGTTIRELESDLRTFFKTVEAAATTAAAAAKVVLERLRLHAQTLAVKHAEQDAAYAKLMASSQEEGGRVQERSHLEGSVAAATAAAKDVEALNSQRAAIVVRREGIVAKLSELRDRRFSARKRVAEDLTARLDAAIRVTVTQSADLGRYVSFLTDALKGAGLKQGPAAERLSQALLPSELADAVAEQDIAPITGAGFDDVRARRILDALTSDGRVYDLDGIEIDDVPRIELRDGDQYKDSPNLSTGQRCTTILPILLIQSERPLLVDQPEDNLDNKFIYETVVKALRAAKGKRQVIFVTHNPNIPVLGEAERVFVFDSDGSHAHIRRRGTVDECKGEIETILEGGREAFRQRKERYGH